MNKVSPNSSDPTRYVKKMISAFTIPPKDALTGCLLSVPGQRVPVWDSAIFLSTEQSKSFYSDIFHFWVRAFFCFVEDVRAGSLFRDVVPFIACREISPEIFRDKYLDLIQQRTPDPSFLESQGYSKTHVDLEKRSFSNTWTVFALSNIESSVAHSDGEYVAYFVAVTPSNRGG